MPLYFSFNGIVWKILCDSGSPLVAVELRNYENREVSFVLINTKLKEIIWQGNNPEESWWTGIEAFNNKIIYLHGYRDIQFPEHKGMWALSEKGKVLWVDKEKAFLHLAGDNLYSYTKEGDTNRFYWLDAATGKVVKKLDEDEALKNPNSEKVDNFVNNPAHYKADNQYFSKLAAFTEQYTGLKAVTAIDYLEYKNKIILSFYTAEQEKLHSHLLLISEDGSKELEELTGTELSGIGIDTFFVCRDILFFVKNKKELVLNYLTT